MTAKARAIAVVFLVLVGGTACFLLGIQSRQKVGKPGLRVVDKPIHDEKGKEVGQRSIDLPAYLGTYLSTEEPVTTIELNWLPKDTTFGRRIYKSMDGFQSAISVVLMGTDRTSIHKPQFCLLGQGWRIDRSEVISVPIPKPAPYDLKAMKMTLSKPAVIEGRPVTLRGIYIYWFVADGQLTPYHGERMWWMARDMITSGVLQRWAYVTYFCVCLPEKEAAVLGRMKQFIGESLPLFQLTSGRVAQADAPPGAAQLTVK